MIAVVAAVVSAILLLVAGTRIFRSRAFGALSAALFGLTPLLIAQSRQPTGPHLALPFVTAWLVCLAHSDGDPRRWWLAAAGAVLGGGLYSHVSALVMMPIYLALSVVWLIATRRPEVASFGALATGFVVAAAPRAVSLVMRPADLRGEIMRFHIFDASRFNYLQGLREVASWVGLTARSEIYYDYFNPWFLFLQGSSLMDTVRHPQVLLLPLAVLLPIGIYTLIFRNTDPIGWLVMGAFLLAPAAAALVVEPYVARRIVFMLPFAALISSYGARQLLTSQYTAARLLGAVALTATPIAFLLALPLAT